MRVRADTKSNYLFDVDYYELNEIKGSDFPPVVATASGFTFPAYSEIDTAMIKGAVFHGAKVKQSLVAASETHFLTLLDLCVHVQTGEIIEIAQLFNRRDFEIRAQDSRFICNHIPQIFYPSSLGVITGIDGVYDFEKGLFKGFLQFGGWG